MININLNDELDKWFNGIKKYFEDFKPEAKSMSIDYQRKKGIISFVLNVPSGFRKNHNKIKLPIYAGYQIMRMYDESFNDIHTSWVITDDYLVFDASKLSSSESFFIELEGNLNDDILENLVYIKPSINRDSDNLLDKYWLDASLRNPDILEKIWSNFEISDVDAGVLIDIEKLIGLRIPSSIRSGMESLKDYLAAAQQFDRNKIFVTARRYSASRNKVKSTATDYYNLITTLISKQTLGDYLYTAKNNFTLGNVESPKDYKGIIPQDVKIHTLTRLTLNKPQSIDTLIFKRKDYLDFIAKEFSEFV